MNAFAGIETRPNAPRVGRVLLAAALVVVAAALCVASLWAQGRVLPSWVGWPDSDQVVDLDGDGAPEHIALRAGRLSIQAGDGSGFSADPGWRVTDAFVSDIDHDSVPELILLAWKRGSYGDHRPFWVERNDVEFAQHVFIFKFANGQLQPQWMSSALPFRATGARMDDEGHLYLRLPDGIETAWEWLTWGLVEAEVPSVGSGETEVPEPTEGYVADVHIVQSDKAPGEDITLIAVGDNLAHESIYQPAYVPGTALFDFDPIYDDVRETISVYDIAVVNQETIFVHDPALRGDYPLFGTPDSMGDALIGSGFNVVLAATNHVNDRGQTGIADTLAFWANHPDVALLGLHATPDDAAAIDYLDVAGTRIAVFNATFGMNGRALPEGLEYQVDVIGDAQWLERRVAYAEGQADLTICFLHMGEEYESEPTAEQRALAGRLVEAGADVVIGTHPHVLQPVEEITGANGNTGIVYFSLGNFVAHQDDPGTKVGGAASLVIRPAANGEPAHVVSYDLLETTCELSDEGARVRFL